MSILKNVTFIVYVCGVRVLENHGFFLSWKFPGKSVWKTCMNPVYTPGLVGTHSVNVWSSYCKWDSRQREGLNRGPVVVSQCSLLRRVSFTRSQYGRRLSIHLLLMVIVMSHRVVSQRRGRYLLVRTYNAALVFFNSVPALVNILHKCLRSTSSIWYLDTCV